MEAFLPEGLEGGLERWLKHGIDPGSFLMAVIENNLTEAVGRADHNNLRYLPNIVSYFYNNVPRTAWGSKERADAWRSKFIGTERM